MDEALWLPVIDGERCTGCGDCIVVCPTQALSLVEGVAVVAEPGACDYAGLCEMVCPVEAIALPYQVVLGDGE
jgi:electron transfer flavoprotein alpha subunit